MYVICQKIPDIRQFLLYFMLKIFFYRDTNIGYTTTTKRFSAYTLRGRSPSSVSAKPLSGSGITGLYHSNVCMADHKKCMADSA